jgi:hypothetical protein
MKNLRFIVQLLVFLASGFLLSCKTSPGKPSYTLVPWNQKGVASASSGELARKMRISVQQDPSLSRYLLHLDLSERDGSLVLGGSVPSQQIKDALKTLADRVAGGGDHVIDQLQLLKSGS